MAPALPFCHHVRLPCYDQHNIFHTSSHLPPGDCGPSLLSFEKPVLHTPESCSGQNSQASIGAFNLLTNTSKNMKPAEDERSWTKYDSDWYMVGVTQDC
jgi:hypothetical protein